MLTIVMHGCRYPVSPCMKMAFGDRFLLSEGNGDGKKQRFADNPGVGTFPLRGIRLCVEDDRAATYRW